MNPFKNTSAKEVRGRLLINGMSVASFARRHGYDPRIVVGVLRRFCGHDKEPRGIKTAAILSKVYAAIQEENNHEC